MPEVGIGGEEDHAYTGIMKVSVKYEHWLPKFLGFGAITLYPFILIKWPRPTFDDPELLQMVRVMVKHEMIHVKQIREQGFFKFYAKYVWDWVRNFFKGHTGKDAYYAIPAEIEAYHGQYEDFSSAEKAELADEILG